MNRTEHKISNWVESSYLEVRAASDELIHKYGPLTHILCSAGSLSFQHSVTPEQAREMAAALITAADESEAIAAERQVAA